MKPPSNPTVFRTSQRHYHRNGRSRDEAWDAWIGDERRSGSWLLRAVLLLLILGAAVGAWLLLK